MNELEPSWAKGYPGGPRWRRVAATRDLPTIAWFRSALLLRRHGPCGHSRSKADRGDYG